MAIVLAFTNLKGGSGKSTLALNVASALHRAGDRTLLVDADPQGSCLAWADRASDAGHAGAPCVAITANALRRDLHQISDGFEVVIIDTPARLGMETRAALLVADMAVMPITPGALDLWAAAETVEAIVDARESRDTSRPDLRAVAVLNRADRTVFTRKARRAIEDLGIRALDCTVALRVAFAQATLEGRGVVDHAPKSEAAREARRLTRAIIAAATAEEEVEA